jgi:hypothetical protein
VISCFITLRFYSQTKMGYKNKLIFVFLGTVFQASVAQPIPKCPPAQPIANSYLKYLKTE